MWIEEHSEAKGRPSFAPRQRASGGGSASSTVRQIGIWVQGSDRLGAAYEGIWRVIKRFILSSEGQGVRFLFVAPVRFREELDLFISHLSSELQESVTIEAFEQVGTKHEAHEVERQAAFANTLEVDAWLVPNPMWGGAKYLIRPKLVWFHDFLLVEFPQSYSRSLFLEFQSNVRDLLEAGAFFIFTSPYVKEKHGHEFCGVPIDQSMLILNPPIDAAPQINLVPNDPLEAGNLIRAELRENLKEWCSPEHAELFFHHISSYPFESVPYLWVSSQNREHKGFLRLAQAHLTFVRKHYLPYPIFTTALVDVEGQSPLERFLRKELFLGDFMSVGKVGELTHALLYKFARLTVHPSTFEGNLPLPFAESLSVGTPCIMPFSRAFVDYVDASMHPWIFYNPTAAGLLKKIREVESHRSEFVAAQREVLDALRQHSLKDFFRLHMEAFSRAKQTKPRTAQFFFESASGARIRKGDRVLDRLLARQARPEIVDRPQARIWEEFELAAAREEGGTGKAVLHWAAYLGREHPAGESHFLVCLDGDEQALASNPELVAEIGSWIGDEYRVADSCKVEFGEPQSLPTPLRHVAALMGATPANRPSARIGWVALNWKEGTVPEIRVGGKLLPPRASLRARVGVANSVAQARFVPPTTSTNSSAE